MSVFRVNGTGSLLPEGFGPEQPGGDGRILSWDGRPIGTAHSLVESLYDIEDVIGFEPLWESMEKCKRGVMWKGSVASFVLNAPENIDKLVRQLHDGTYKPGNTRTFWVTSPKKREIKCIPFPDRVVQRSYNDVVLYPCMSSSWIYDNAACQKGKGTDFARNRLKCHLERHYRSHGMTGGILILDVRGYYRHMLFDFIDYRFHLKCPSWSADFASDTIRRQYGTSANDICGVNPGSQMVQIAGVDYLDPVDHEIKERLGIRGYVRYMDDLIIIHENVGYLHDCLSSIAASMGDIGLEPHPKKTKIIGVNDKFSFLGFDYMLSGTGRVVMTLRPESVKRMRRKVSRLLELERRGERPVGTALESYRGWYAHAAKGDSKMLLRRCDQWYTRVEQEALLGGR